MEAVIFQQNVDPLPIERYKPEVINHEGILNTEYKRVAKRNLTGLKTSSIYTIRTEVRRNQFRLVGGIDTLLKIALFGIAIAVALI